MSNEIEQALQQRDAAIMLGMDKLSGKADDLADRLMAMEQKSAHAGIDLSGAPPKPSLMKIMKHLSNPRDCPLTGQELEWHSELQSKSGQSFPGAVYYPLQTKNVDYATPNLGSPLTSAGGSNLVAQQLHPELIDVLRARSVIMQQGVTMIPAVGDLDIPKKTSGSTGYWLDLDGADTITESTPVFTLLQQRPHCATGLTKFSYRMGLQTSGGVERILEQDLAATLAEAIDLAALQGSGSSSEPLGILNSGISSLVWGGSDSPQAWPTDHFWWEDALLMEQTLIDSKAYQGNLSFLVDAITYKMASHKANGQDSHMAMIDRVSKTLLGHPVQPTTHLPARTALFGNWADMIVSTWGGIALSVDHGGANFAKGDTSVRAILPIDFGVRHVASFVKSVG